MERREGKREGEGKGQEECTTRLLHRFSYKRNDPVHIHNFGKY